jgi:hypothetical protein
MNLKCQDAVAEMAGDLGGLATVRLDLHVLRVDAAVPSDPAAVLAEDLPAVRICCHQGQAAFGKLFARLVYPVTLVAGWLNVERFAVQRVTDQLHVTSRVCFAASRF